MILVNSEEAMTAKTSVCEMIYPTVTYDFVNTPATPIEELFRYIQKNEVYFVAIGDF